MPKPLNETIGRCACSTPGCLEVADVRRAKNHPRGALYLVCQECGTIRAGGRPFQDYVIRRADWVPATVGVEEYERRRAELEEGEEPGPEPEPPEPGPEPEPEPDPLHAIPVQAPPRPRRGFFAWLNDFHL